MFEICLCFEPPIGSLKGERGEWGLQIANWNARTGKNNSPRRHGGAFDSDVCLVSADDAFHPAEDMVNCV